MRWSVGWVPVRWDGLIGQVVRPSSALSGTWKRSYGYRRVRYFSMAANAIELQIKALAFNLRRAAALAAA